MIGATAQGIRLSQSKLRYYTQDYSHSLFSLVRGKEVWRIIGASAIEPETRTMDPNNKKLHVRILALLKRLLHGEEKNEKLFEIVENFHNHLLDSALTREDGELVEYVTVLRILNQLGYVSNRESFQSLVSNVVVNEEILLEVKKRKDMIIQEINKGLKESHL